MIQVIGMKTTKSNIKALSACVTGPMHKSQGKPCQDYCRYSTNKQNFVAIISDGAGSAKYGRIGAKIVCDTLIDLLANAPYKEIKSAIINAINQARKKLYFHRLNSKNNPKGIMSFSATIVGVVYYQNKGIFFHIGDGAGIAFLDSNFNNYIASKPQNGAFSCETYFYTMNDWQNYLRFCSFEKAHTIMLMSDGLTNFAFSANFDNIEKNFIIPIDNFLSKEKLKSKAKRALQNTLNTSQAKKLNSDDKTFLWAKIK